MTKGKDNQEKFDGVAGFEVDFEVGFKCQTCSSWREPPKKSFLSNKDAQR